MMPIEPLIPAPPGIVILDQTRLPHATRTLTLCTVEACAQAIEAMQVRGAPLIGVTAAFGVALAMQADATDAGLVAALTRLAHTRPTAINLHWALGRMAEHLKHVVPAARAEAAWQHACMLRDADIAANAAIGRNGQPLFEGDGAPVRVMTHCNAGTLATCGGGTALAPIYHAAARGRAVHVWVSETRPRNQGLLTAWELEHAGIPHCVIADNAAGLLLMRGEVDLVIVGADRIAANGDTANKIGTYLKALAAVAHNVPFYVAAPTSSVDTDCRSGTDIPIEGRAAEEMQQVWGVDANGDPASLVQTRAPCANPAFDITPAGLIRGIITEKGLFAPEHILEALA